MIVTFYSYKGGVGRSMALMNVAEILADVGYDVIVCDFDLEAPGLERYAADDLDVVYNLRAGRGVLDLLEEYRETLAGSGPVPQGSAEPTSAPEGFRDIHGLFVRRPSSCAVPVSSPNTGRLGQISFLGAGRRDGDWAIRYSERVQQFDWSDFYQRWAGAAYVDFFREDLTEGQRIVLVDSRTGVAEYAGICTHHLADLIVLLSAPNDVNIEGTKWMASTIAAVDLDGLRGGRPLQVMPVAARVETASQAEELAEFRKRFEREFTPFVPAAAGMAQDFIHKTEIPYIPYFAFTEKVVARQDVLPHRELYSAYEALARAVVNVGLDAGILTQPERTDWLTQFGTTDGLTADLASERQALSPGGSWDFFISYAQADRAWAEWIAWTLEEAGYRILLQAWDFVPGSNWVQSMQAGVRDAARTITVLSAEYLNSVYGGAEWQAAWARDPAGSERRLLTVRVNDSDRPGLLAGVVGVDLFGITEDAANTRLLRMVSAAVGGRAKPTVAPDFPRAGRAVPRAGRFPGALPRVWNVPPRNPAFTGRDPELEELARRLAAGSTVTLVSVRGLGGIGKTQLAAEYAYAHATDYDVVWWIAAEEPAFIPDQFAALAAEIGLEPVTSPEALRVMVHERLRSVPGWLLIFDNADRVEDIGPWLPGGLLPPGVSGHVIVTARRGGFAALGPVLDLNVIGLPDAVRMLRARVPALDQATADQIARELGQLPLALAQAAAWLDRSQMPGQEYLELLRRRGQDLYARGQVTGRSDTIATVWDISVSHLTTENPAAVQLLGVCAYLAPELIPLDLFTAHADLLPEPLSSAAADQLAFADVLASLVDYSLANRTQAGLQLHRLVQATIRAGYGSPLGADLTRHPLPVGVRLLRADAPPDIVSAPQNWPRWAVLLPHVLAAVSHIDSVATQLDAELMSDTAWLLNRAGAYLQVRARFADARSLQERALAIDEAAYGPDHPAVAHDLANLAALLRILGDPSAARPLQERALAITEAAYGPDHPDIATSLNNMGQILLQLGQPEAARPLQERALAIDEAAYGPDHPDIATSLNNMGQILLQLGQPEAARPLQERALAITEAAYGPDHPDIATSLNNLAQILLQLGQPEAARPLQERALAIDEAAYGPDHPAVARDLANLAILLQELGDPSAARPLQERALAIDEAAYGPDHPAVARDLANLATLLQALGDLNAAQSLQERAMAIEHARRSPG